MAFIKRCPKCGGPMVEYTGNEHYKLIITDRGVITGIEEIKVNVVLCKKCHYAEVNESTREIKLPVELPKEFVYAIAENLLSYLYHKL